MKIVLDLKNKPKIGDILIFEKDGFKCVGPYTLLENLNNKYHALELYNTEFLKIYQNNKKEAELKCDLLEQSNLLLGLEIKLLKGEIDEEIYIERKSEIIHKMEELRNA